MLIIILVIPNSLASEKFNKDQMIIENEEIYNEKTFSGPMGMGLIKSYQTKNKKICVYNTVNGQIEIYHERYEIICPKIIREKN